MEQAGQEKIRKPANRCILPLSREVWGFYQVIPQLQGSELTHQKPTPNGIRCLI
jgi:hypothetical protein